MEKNFTPQPFEIHRDKNQHALHFLKSAIRSLQTGQNKLIKYENLARKEEQEKWHQLWLHKSLL